MAAGRTSYELQLLGPPEVRRTDGESVGIPAGKPLALLIYLHLSLEAVSRDHLAQLLWSGSTRERARGSVRHALWFLRKELGEDIFAEDDPVRLAGGRITSDLHRVRESLASGRIEEAEAAWTGSAPELADLADGVEWNHWVEAVRMDLERQFAGALSERGNAERERGEPLRAARFLRQAVAAQPHRVQHHLDLVEALLDARAFEEAVAALEEARQGVPDGDGDPRLDLLEERIDLLRRGAGPTDPEDPTLQIEFTGREEEFSALLRRWRLAQDGEPGVGLITGEPGIGKTRLAQELAVVVQADAGRVVHLKAEDSERPIEWGLLSEVIQRLLSLSGAAGVSHASDGVLRTLVPSLSLADPATTDGSGRGGLFLPRNRPSAALSDALVDLVSAVAEDVPLLLVVDDLQWADTESRSVLARVATRLRGAPVLLLFTCRSDVESVRVRKTLALLAEGPRTTAIELTPWSQAEVDRVLRSRLVFEGKGSEESIIRRIHRTTRGNPLFVIELLKAFQEEGIVEEDEAGRWIFRKGRLPPDIPLPQSLRALVDRQLEQLSEEAKLVAAHLARIGHPTSPRMLAARTGLGTSPVTNGIGELLQRRMVRWESPETLTFLHDELRAAVARRFQLHVGLTAGGGAQWSFFRTAVIASLGLLLLGAAAYVFAPPAPTSPVLFGGGSLVVVRDDAAEAYRFQLSDVDTGFELRRTNPTPPPPPTPASPGPIRLTSGELTWVTAGPLGMAADGVHALVTESLDEDRHRLLFRNVETGEARTIYEGVRPPEEADLSPLGQRVVFRVPGYAGAIVVATPGGRPLARWNAPGILRAHWCGPDRVLVLVRENDHVEARLWDPAEGSATPVRMEGVHLGGATTCSPDGTALVLQGAWNGRVGLFLHRPAAGTWQELTLDPGGVPDRIHWVPDAVPPLPAGIRIAGRDTVGLSWGEQIFLQGELFFPDGSTRGDPLEWESRDPGVAYVAPTGRATAASAGDTWVVAEWNGWLRDSVHVRVLPSQGGNTLFREAFEDPRLTGWHTPAGPLPWEVRGDEGVLRLVDDGGGTPALRTEPSFDLREGATLEMEFRLPLSEAEGQSVALCLAQLPSVGWGDDDGDDVPKALATARGAARQSGCVRYPAGTGDQWDPRRLEIHSHGAFPETPIDVGESLPRDGWVHLALSLGEDGRIGAYLDRQWVGSAPVHLEQGSGPWSVVLHGEARETELEIRALSLWPTLRYGPGAGTGGR